ncbi:MAG TPA: cytochrome c peroxidase [Haliangiales bacterium]|nr:cytochrome c peroxidase [Haliangiales bacterium]
MTLRLAIGAALLVATAGCRRDAPGKATEPAARTAFYASTFSKRPSVPAMTALGRALFFDPALSASGKLACATCHDPARAYGPPGDGAVALGGPTMTAAGVRAVPSLRYLQQVPPFTEHFHDSDENDSLDQGPAGGRTWDGRAQSAHDQARLPLLSPLEMANASLDAVAAKVAAAPYAPKFRETFGDDVFADPALATKAILLALEVFQQSPAEFYPYTSKYDAYLRGQAKLTDAEARGLALFNAPAKGNCASCHPSAIKGGGFPAFSDFGFVAVGVPRNPEIPANADPAYFDLGLCGPFRTDLRGRHEYCGMFRTPTLRNVALKRRFFHNGSFRDLTQVVRFYVERDVHPEKFYPRGAFDDLPPEYRANVNAEPPFGRRAEPALTEADIADVVAFLGTLTDGYGP